jgi:protein-L-isoaspartate(D-aspartate) O-methyltransferase
LDCSFKYPSTKAEALMFEEDRKNMVKYQLERRGIIDKRVLDAIFKIERHLFIDEADANFAYDDRPLGIGCGQTISQPYIVGLMTQTLELKGNESVLEIGTGSGYQTAILAALARIVYTVERVPELMARVERRLKAMDFKNIVYRTGDGSIGWAEKGLFDRILVAAASPKVPKQLFDQLNPGGRMVLPVGGRMSQELTLVIKRLDGEMQVLHRGGCLFVPLLGQAGWKEEPKQ